MRYRPEIDGLRAIAVIPVILFHAGFEIFSGGFVGVDIFFVISGYLITSIILFEMNEGKFSILSFYERRARRILPALFVVLFVCLPFAWLWLLPADMKSFSQSLVAVSAFASNILFWRTSGYFDSASELKPLLHTWSLAVEEQYYLLFPAFLMFTWRLGKYWISATLTAAAILSLAAAQLLVSTKQAETFYLLPTRGWELLIGAFVAFYFSNNVKPNINNTASQLGGVIGLLLIIYAIFAFDKQTPFPSLYALVPTVGAALIILFASHQTAVGKFLGSKLFVGVGVISYSAYLWHQPLFAFAKHISLDEPSKLLLAALAVAAVALAYFSWKYIEAPFRNKNRFSRSHIFKLGTFGSLFFVVFGLAGHFSNGFTFPYRYSLSDQSLVEVNLPGSAEYVSKRFTEFSLKSFEDSDGRKKILIIGDSYAEDLVNALFEVGVIEYIQISTRHISKLCGNLFIPRHDFSKNIAPEDVKYCEDKGIYEDKSLRNKMLEADEVWFASSWQYWQAQLISTSIRNVKDFANKPLRVFGRKNFGEFKLRKLLLMNETTRYAFRNEVPEFQIEVNELMKESLDDNVFIDVQRILCGDNKHTCSLFTKEGFLITFDGTHLTDKGAKYYGDKLLREVAILN